MSEEEQEEEASEETASHYEIEPRLKALIERGYAAQAAREEMDRRVGELVNELDDLYPDQSKTLRSVLDGHRQRLLAEDGKKRREAQAVSPPKGKSNDGEDKKGTGVP